MKKLSSIFFVLCLIILPAGLAMATGNTHNNNNGNTHNNNHTNTHTNIHNHNNNNGNGGGGEVSNDINIDNDSSSTSTATSTSTSTSTSTATSTGGAGGEGTGIGIGGDSSASVGDVEGGDSSSTASVGNVGGGAGGVGIGGNSSSSSSASIGDVQASVTFNEAKQYPVPGEINLPGVLNTPNNDRPGPSYYDPREMVFIKYVFTVEELKDMAGSHSPATTGDLQEKEVLPEAQQSRTIAFYIETLPNGLEKENVQQVGMMSLDSNSKKISTVTLFGVLGLEAAKRGANAVVISGEGYQRVDKAFSFGPGASMTSPTGNSIATVALPFIYAQRWKVDNPWLHGTAVIVPTT